MGSTFLYAVGGLALLLIVLRQIARSLDQRPEMERWWTTIYYGARGSGKTLHQAKEVLKILQWLDKLYKKNRNLKHAIVFSVQKFSDEIEKKYAVYTYGIKEVFDEAKQKNIHVIDFSTRKMNNPAGYLYYWDGDDPESFKYCPRPSCWRGKEKHKLHGCYLVFDDMANYLPAGNWQNTPVWMIKLFSQARHFGIRIISNMQDPFSVDINFRRYVDMAFRFKKIFSSKDPDETKPAIKRIFGVYMRRRIRADLLWKFGNMADDEINLQVEQLKQQNEVNDTKVFTDLWKSSYHWIGKKITSIYDTTQDVPEYKPQGFMHEVLYCIDPRHNHDDPKAENYCNYKKVIHELV